VYTFVVRPLPPNGSLAHSTNGSINGSTNGSTNGSLASALRINGIMCVTLGHGIAGDLVASHPFLGTQKVVGQLQAARGWANGFVDMRPGCMSRDAHTGLTNGLLMQKECSYDDATDGGYADAADGCADHGCADLKARGCRRPARSDEGIASAIVAAWISHKDTGALSSLNLAKNFLGELLLPEGWQRTGETEWTHSDGAKVTENPGNPSASGVYLQPQSAL
jgi:hypothetical protein